MADKVLKVQQQQARKTEAEWIAQNPILKNGQLAYSSDKSNKYKIGDGTSTWSKLAYVIPNKTDIGLGNVDNTSDANKPISTATQNALNTKLNVAIKGTPNGIAELDSTGKVPSSQLPAMSSLELGETQSTAYRGDRGKVAYDHSQSTHARVDATMTEKSSTNGNIKINGAEVSVYKHPDGTNPHGTTKSDVGLGNVDNTSDINKPISTAVKSALDGKANVSHGTHVTYDTNVPKNLGTASVGTATTVSRSDHVHNLPTKADIGLSNVENKTGATIRSEMTKAEVVKALGYTPPETGGGGVYVGTTAPANTSMLWIDSGNNNVSKFYNGTAWTPVPAIWG